MLVVIYMYTVVVNKCIMVIYCYFLLIYICLIVINCIFLVIGILNYPGTIKCFACGLYIAAGSLLRGADGP